MEIQFENPQLRETCLSLLPTSGALPRRVLAVLRDVLNEMRSADHLDEVVLGQAGTNDLVEDLEWSINLGQGYVAIFRINHSKPPMTKIGIDRARVHRVRVVAIEAPND